MKFTDIVALLFLQSCCVLSIDVDSICGPDTNGDLVESIHSARQVAGDWLIGRRERHFGWRQGNSAAAVTSLQLSNQSFSRDNESLALERDLTIKQLHIEILSLLSKSERSRPSNSLATSKNHRQTIDRLPYFIMALKATCQNTTDFHGINLISRLSDDMKLHRRDRVKRYFQHALGILAMCSTGHPIKRRYIEDLLEGQQSDGCYLRQCTSTACGSSADIDTTAMVLSALSCVHRTDIHRDEELVEAGISNAVDCLLQSNQNGSFGNVITDAMAAQGLLAAEVNHSRWDCHSTLGSVLGAMHTDGHYGSLAATIHVLPLLAGRHHRHLNEVDVQCPEEYSYNQVPDLEDFSSSNAIRILLEVSTDTGSIYYEVEGPHGESLLELMHREQDISNAAFSFDTKTTDWGEYIININGIENDDGSGQHWILERVQNREPQCIDKGAGDIYPEGNEHYLWTHRYCGTETLAETEVENGIGGNDLKKGA